MGTADVIPGVSGGTVAFILGIYATLIESIKSFDTRWLTYLFKGEWRRVVSYPRFDFLLPLVIGIFAALMFFTRIIPLPTYIHTHPVLIYGLFFGLIVGSIIVLTRQLGQSDRRSWLFISAGILLGFLLVTLVPVTTPETSWFVFISGMLAISAMLLPGISGSFILLILRKYAYIFEAIGRLDFTVLIPFMLGTLCGLIAFSRILSWLLHHFFRPCMQMICGILIGSLWVIWPFQRRVYETIGSKPQLVHTTPYWPNQLDDTVMGSLGLILLGLIIVLWIDHRSGKQGIAVAKPAPD